MTDFYHILFGVKGNFITTDEGRTIFIGGPGSGGGGASGNTAITSSNVGEIVRELDDAQLASTLSDLSFQTSQVAQAYTDVERVVSRLTAGNIRPDQAVNWLSAHPLKTDAENVSHDAQLYLGQLRLQRNDLMMMRNAAYQEYKRRMGL